MRKINYDQFKKEVVKRNASLPKGDSARLIRRKPRAQQELQYLIKHALLRKERALASKEYEILAPRRWRVNATKHSD